MPMRPPPPRRGAHSPEPLVDDLMREIFLRLAPNDPRGLVRAAAGCRGWRGILSDAAFARDYRAARRAPPVLGYLYDERRYEEGHSYWVPHFESTATFRPPAWEEEDRRDWRALDSRHGLVLFYAPTLDDAEFVVCDLITGDEWEIQADPDYEHIMWWRDDSAEVRFERIRCKATVFCSSDRCDHLDCHGGPFCIALVGCEEDGIESVATVYSSETDEWSQVISVQNADNIDGTGHCAVVGNKVYVPCVESDSFVEYDIGEKAMSVIDLPPVGEEQPYLEFMGLEEDGMLLFASVVNPTLYLWSMKTSPSGAAGWARRRVFQLEPFLPPPSLQEMSEVLAVGFAEGVIFLRARGGLYRIDLDSGEHEKVHGGGDGKVMTYMSFYTGEWGQLQALE